MAFGDAALAALEHKKAGMYELLLGCAGQLEGHAKLNAPWHDFTAHARQGLNAGVDRVGANKYAVYLSHGVEYGIFLELAGKTKDQRQALLNLPGPYAIVTPTMDLFLPTIRKAILDYWGG